MISSLRSIFYRSRGGRELIDRIHLKRLKHDAKIREHDDKVYGGWKSAGLVFSDVKEKPSVIGRLDWHLVQFMLALLPACGLYALAQWARHDMENNPHFRKIVDKNKKQSGDTDDSVEKSELQKRLLALEETVREMQKQYTSSSNDNDDKNKTQASPQQTTTPITTNKTPSSSPPSK